MKNVVDHMEKELIKGKGLKLREQMKKGMKA